MKLEIMKSETIEKLKQIKIDGPFIGEEEINKVNEILNIKNLTDQELQDTRNSFVYTMNEQEREEDNRFTFKNEQILSAVTAVIDQEKFYRGMMV